MFPKCDIAAVAAQCTQAWSSGRLAGLKIQRGVAGTQRRRHAAGTHSLPSSSSFTSDDTSPPPAFIINYSAPVPRLRPAHSLRDTRPELLHVKELSAAPINDFGPQRPPECSEQHGYNAKFQQFPDI
ncbi:unnamed protein product [Pleuronectes platessa]|uniref:Uncharacterized protein n=1 Tax=Pleuronectes platessa TaxID=8262 RepID=A0A9N7U9G3_PLEPL|nr:unnamed protein product [Pleuronectes platessa]